MRNSKKKVIIIDDETIILDTYEYFINSFDEYTLIGKFTTIESALRDYESLYPDIIISDISMPGMSGIDGISKFKKIDRDVKVILVSVHDEVEYIVKSIENELDGYLTKPITKDSFKQALDSLEFGGKPIASKISKVILDLLKDKKDTSHLKKYDFSRREIEILDLFTQGLTYKSIADKLFITASTVNFHIQNIYCKLDVTNKSDALNKLKK